jgi:hypothetical protein
MIFNRFFFENWQKRYRTQKPIKKPKKPDMKPGKLVKKNKIVMYGPTHNTCRVVCRMGRCQPSRCKGIMTRRQLLPLHLLSLSPLSPLISLSSLTPPLHQHSSVFPCYYFYFTEVPWCHLLSIPRISWCRSFIDFVRNKATKFMPIPKDGIGD